MSLINVKNLTFAYEGSYDNVFLDLSFQIDTNWKIGFCGRNGRGKTTLLKLLLGSLEFQGEISHCEKFDYFPFNVTNRDDWTIDVILSIADVELWQIQKELSKLNVDHDVLYRPFFTLSNGEQTKVLLAALFLRQNNFLLIDEPTNHLDVESREIVGRYLKSKAGFILISHDRAFLDQCVDHILAFNKSSVEVLEGNYSTWEEQKRRRDSFEMSQNQRLEGEIAHLKNAAKQTSLWSDKVEKSKYGTLNSGSKQDKGYVGHKSAKMMKRSKAIEKRQTAAIEQKSKLLQDVEVAEQLKIHPLTFHSQRLLSLLDLSIFYGEKMVVEKLNFTLFQGQRVAFCGSNGSGKSSILKLFSGQKIAYSGELNIGSRLIVSYVPQDTSFLKGSLKEFVDENAIDETLFKAILRKLDFSREQFDKNLQDFSAGQKKKVLIAASLSQKAHVYIWDEPLNYIDIMSRIQIENLILQFQPTMIFVEHDKVFCDKIATEVVKL